MLEKIISERVGLFGETNPMIELKKYFELEKKKHFEFYLPFYQQQNWQVVEDNIGGNKPIDWDVKLEVFVGQYKLIDEKVRQGEFNDCLIELIQDFKTKKLGWFFGEKDWILYGNWKDIESIYPSSLYLVKSEELKNYICGLDGFIKTCISKKGWGITWCVVLSWDSLIDGGIAEKLI